jgi:hypothetical protein
MIVFALFVFPHLKDYGIQFAANPADRPKLNGKIRATIQVKGMSKDFLRLLESDPTLWICTQFLALALIEVESHPSITVIPLQNTSLKVPMFQDHGAKGSLPASLIHPGHESGDNCKIDYVEL